MIFVTELSRFTHYSGLLNSKRVFRKASVHVLSVKENFDTSTAAGELVRYMMANIAEFEREQTAKRISHSFLARAKRGLYNGGSFPMGYKIDQNKLGSGRALSLGEIFSIILSRQTTKLVGRRAEYLCIVFVGSCLNLMSNVSFFRSEFNDFCYKTRCLNFIKVDHKISLLRAKPGRFIKHRILIKIRLDFRDFTIIPMDRIKRCREHNRVVLSSIFRT
ncbi:MAG: recombinase family protein [Bdellovibrionales bacterium]|nr:recombinase family protein [Bdellovibrionales bacterium]